MEGEWYGKREFIGEYGPFHRTKKYIFQSSWHRGLEWTANRGFNQVKNFRSLLLSWRYFSLVLFGDFAASGEVVQKPSGFLSPGKASFGRLGDVALNLILKKCSIA